MYHEIRKLATRQLAMLVEQLRKATVSAVLTVGFSHARYPGGKIRDSRLEAEWRSKAARYTLDNSRLEIRDSRLETKWRRKDPAASN
jgi:hypothetical protein